MARSPKVGSLAQVVLLATGGSWFAWTAGTGNAAGQWAVSHQPGFRVPDQGGQTIRELAALQEQPRSDTLTVAALSTNAPVREVAPGIFQIGKVRLNQAQKTVTFPAAINLTSGQIEYVLVTSLGKVHESLLKTDIAPYHLQVAMLLLGAKGAPPVPLSVAPPGGPIIGATLAGTAPKPLPGDAVQITVTWPAGVNRKRRRIEQLVLDRKRGAPMTEGAFTFNGSRVWNGVFIAERDGSIVSTVTDPDAMFNNPRPGRNDDENWQIIPTELPPAGTPVEVTVTIESLKIEKK
ncbi:MAG: hypothetical protein KGS61_18965 [Verrucomicrobia bacterium]|nr:hypothetical protein [Verrucomicrobiota bacterium]